MSEGTEELSRRAKGRVGTVLDEKWHIDSLLGVGGMAAVYAATHRNGKRAAVKVLHPEVALNASVKARFLREGWVANKVEHPGAVSVLDDDESPDGSVFLVMELLEGETLESRCKYQLHVPAEEVLAIADQVLDVLVAAHGKNIVHRDLKPGNLFVVKDGSIKVLDFGIARLRELSSGPEPSATTVSSMGTPGFMPPEQARGRWEEVDPRADIFAVGATMFNLLTGRYIHEEETINEQLLASMTKPAPGLQSVLPTAAPALAAVVDRALQFKREDRWPDAASMQEAVRNAYQAVTGRPISFSQRLMIVPRASLVDHGEVASAPTLDVSESGAVQALVSLPSSSSAKGVAVTTPSAGVVDPRRRRAVGLMVIGGAVAVSLLLGTFAFRHPPPAAGAVVAAPSSAGEGITSSAVAPPASPPPASAVASTEPSAPPPHSTAPASHTAAHPASHPSASHASGSSVAASTASPPASSPPATATSTAPPADSVDIFGRRR